MPTPLIRLLIITIYLFNYLLQSLKHLFDKFISEY